MTQLSSKLFHRAQQHIPGGVNSPVRAFKNVGGDPLFIAHGEGAYVIDVDDKRYIDYVGSWGPLILGHAHPKVVGAVTTAIKNGLSFGAPTEIEVSLAEKICELMPNIEMVRMVSSGTESTLSAIRLARAFTRRNKILKFNGCYHGHSDALLVKAGSGVLTFGIPGSPGVPEDFVKHTLVAEFNDLATVNKIFEQHGDDIAAIIVEPIAGNMNLIKPLPEFLQGLRQVCDQYQSLLIFDEVMTGFRVALGGAQKIYNIKPDLTTLAKVIGGGMPVGAFGGRKEIMQMLAPQGPVYQAGTLSGNPIAMTAGLTTLNEINQPGFFEQLSNTTKQLITGLNERAKIANIPFFADCVGSMFGFYFTDQKSVDSFADMQKCDLEKFKKFFHLMLEEGIYLAPSMFEAGFVSNAHGGKEMNATFVAVEKVFKKLT